jgi:hypothetical protein
VLREEFIPQPEIQIFPRAPCSGEKRGKHTARPSFAVRCHQDVQQAVCERGFAGHGRNADRMFWSIGKIPATL